MRGETLIIVNPRSRGGRTARVWPSLLPRIEAVLGAVEVAETRGPADAIRLAREAAVAGARLVVAAGGDGTVHEVANGLLEATLGPDGAALPTLGILGMGTGGDFTRTLGIPHRVDAYLEVLRSGVDRLIDAGRARFVDHAGAPAERYFVNILSMGVSGLADRYVARASRALGANFAYVQSSLRALLASRVAQCTCDVVLADGTARTVHLDTHLIAVCNGRYFGSGMMVGPMAEPDDGLFELVTVTEPSRLKLAFAMNGLYTGAHLSRPDCVHLRARRVEVSLRNEAHAGAHFLLDVDGEALGRLPLVIEVLPRALRVRVPSPAA